MRLEACQLEGSPQLFLMCRVIKWDKMDAEAEVSEWCSQSVEKTLGERQGWALNPDRQPRDDHRISKHFVNRHRSIHVE